MFTYGSVQAINSITLSKPDWTHSSPDSDQERRHPRRLHLCEVLQHFPTILLGKTAYYLSQLLGLVEPIASEPQLLHNRGGEEHPQVLLVRLVTKCLMVELLDNV